MWYEEVVCGFVRGRRGRQELFRCCKSLRDNFGRETLPVESSQQNTNDSVGKYLFDKKPSSVRNTEMNLMKHSAV